MDAFRGRSHSSLAREAPLAVGAPRRLAPERASVGRLVQCSRDGPRGLGRKALQVIRGLSPVYRTEFFIGHVAALMVVAAVVLAATSAAGLYAAASHLGSSPIRRAKHEIGTNSECPGRNMVSWLLRSVSPQLFSLPGRRIQPEGQRGGRPWPPQHRNPAPRNSSAHRGSDVRVLASIKFVIFEDNGGDLSLDDRRRTTARPSHSREACLPTMTLSKPRSLSAKRPRRRCSSASSWGRPVDLIARRNAKSDDSDAERWLDEDGSVMRWRQHRGGDEMASAALIAPAEPIAPQASAIRDSLYLPGVPARAASVGSRAPSGVLRA